MTSFDENYLMPGLLAASSALEHSPDDVQLVILGVDLSDSAVDLIENTTPPARTTVHDAANLAGGLPEWKHISNAAWARVGLGSLLGEDVERVVYVDADSYTRGSLEPLFSLDLEGRTLAACIERPLPTHRARHEWGHEQDPRYDYGSESSVPDVYSYFNSGVMAIDLARWRERDVESRVLQVAAQLPPSFFLLDQDAMNEVLADDWLPVDWRLWNWPGFLKLPDAWDAHVVHFVSSPKPWVSHPLGAPFAGEYRDAANQIGWTIDAKTARVKSGLIELVAPYSLVLRRKRIARSIRGDASREGGTAKHAVEEKGITDRERALVVAFDGNYLEPGLVAAASGLEHAPHDTTLFVLGVDLTKAARERITAVINTERVEIIDAGDYASGLPDTMPPAAWARIGVGVLLPETIDRVLYLDSDTLTRGTLSPLFEMDLEGRVLAAAPDEPDPTHRRRHDYGKTLDPSLDFLSSSPVPDVAAYFNSGVLAIDLNTWRRDDVGARLRSFAEELPASFIFPDQDLLNVVLWQEWLPIDWRVWNWPGLKLDRLSWETHIAHFKGPTKPWVANPLGAPFTREYVTAARGQGWNIDPGRYRIKSGVMEAVLPYSVILRRKKISRAMRREPR